MSKYRTFLENPSINSPVPTVRGAAFLVMDTIYLLNFTDLLVGNLLLVAFMKFICNLIDIILFIRISLILLHSKCKWNALPVWHSSGCICFTYFCALDHGMFLQRSFSSKFVKKFPDLIGTEQLRWNQGYISVTDKKVNKLDLLQNNSTVGFNPWYHIDKPHRGVFSPQKSNKYGEVKSLELLSEVEVKGRYSIMLGGSNTLMVNTG